MTISQRYAGFLMRVASELDEGNAPVKAEAMRQAAQYFEQRERELLEENARALQYATQLAIALKSRHFADVQDWDAFPDLIGVLTQIDNMASSLVVPN